MQNLFHWFHDQTLGSWVVFSLVANTAIFAVSVEACRRTFRRFQERRLFPKPQPLTRRDVLLATLAVLLNSGVAIVGWLLWKQGVVTITHPSPGRTLLDTLLLIGLMDAGMYVFHWIAHFRVLFPWVHRTHHTHEATNPLSLFVLNPIEVLGFGGLLVAVLTLVPLSGVAILVYLTFNVVFGTLGHVGVEPFPRRWMRLALVRQIGTSTFHALHHADPRHNFGFYTTVWDRLFGTLHPRYDAEITGGTLA
jgi:sterol desaturase/sphingolipid hydroxylase (fatty acid hydroxylase superfamily)